VNADYPEIQWEH